MLELAQFIDPDSPAGIIQTVVSILFLGLLLFYPRIMVWQATTRLEKDVADLQRMTDHSVRLLARKMKKNPDRQFVSEVQSFLDFFATPPVDVDPRGIIPKLGKTIREQFDSFTEFIDEHADARDPVARRNLEAALINTTGGYQITKIVRHFLEIVKKYKNMQIALIVQMQIPMIKDIAEAVSKSVENLLAGEPVGDGIGPLVAAEIVGETQYKRYKDTQMVYAVKNVDGRKVVIVKADGPGAVIGYPGEALVPLIKKYKPMRILTVDAASKLEGERTGSVAEGVGVVMGPIGVVQRYAIEEVATQKKIPLDAVIVKMRAEESMVNMRKEIYDSIPTVVALVRKKLQRIPRGRAMLLLGVGNTVGIGNNKKELRKTEEILRRGFRKIAVEEKLKAKGEKPFWEK